MKQSLVFKSLALFSCLISISAYGQKQSKTYSEKFTVTADAVLDIDTSHADIDFETWNKDQITIEATVELEGATPEEAEEYFRQQGIEIMGNSKKVSVTTGSGNSWASHAFGNMENLHIKMPELPEFESFEMDFDFAELADVPPLPPTPDPNFDYEAFQKDGEEYLKEWQKNFQENFGEPYQKSMEAWQQKMEAKQEEMLAKREKLLEKKMEAHANRMENRAEAMSKQAEKRAEEHQKRIKINQSRRDDDSTSSYIIRHTRGENRPNTFYFGTEDKIRNFEVKKSIKIKMPKATKIQMNVRHGEVNMAGNTKNMNATLNHASLLAAVIDGDDTEVRASYSPVSVQHWKYGDLQVAYSGNVELQEVLNLHLNATSSQVTIANLNKSAFIKNDFGTLAIQSISDDFETLDVSLENAALTSKLPHTAYNIYVNSTHSEFTAPASLELEKIKNHGSIVHKGYQGDKNSTNAITIHSKYSEVVLE